MDRRVVHLVIILSDLKSVVSLRIISKNCFVCYKKKVGPIFYIVKDDGNPVLRGVKSSTIIYDDKNSRSVE